MNNSINKFVHSKFDIHPEYKSIVYQVTPVNPSETMSEDDLILGTVAKFKECDDWFIYIYNFTKGSADILNLGRGNEKYKRVSRYSLSPEQFLYKLTNKET